ncbi:hypothetical protein AB833_14760 [Chromatiales bacterium (ex Bugula neritina AB1)]|nr:hypothetical protein AB833_14760 [Chromatiales bacterium (ex Bugula neritina AB1)]
MNRSLSICLNRLLNCFLLLVLLAGLSACGNTADQNSGEESRAISLHTELGGSAEGFKRACEPRQFSFPEDHGPHVGFRNEWWYITGNVTSEQSQVLGFHATFFRIANEADETTIESAIDENSAPSSWAASQFYMAHFAISSTDSDQVRAHERFARAAAGLAGAQTEPVRVWLDDWSLTETQRSTAHKPEWLLQLEEADDQLELLLTAQKPVILQGDSGYSQKSHDPCNASYYYSVTRMTAAGEVRVAGAQHNVSGTAWLDREWSSSALSENQQGWDWFALQLSDGRDLMYYQLRSRNGGRDPQSYAVEVGREGEKRILPLNQITLEVTRWWKSDSGSNYPVAGVLRRADTGEVIHYKPLIDNQELSLTIQYWEGAIQLTNGDGEPIGTGYLELTGY